MAIISYLRPVQSYQFQEVAPLAKEAKDANFTLGKALADAWAAKNKTGQESYDLYSPADSYWNEQVQNYPGERSVQTGHEMLEIAKHKDYKQLLNDLPYLSFCGVGLDVVGESMLATLLNRFTLFDEFEVFLKRDQDALKKGYLVGHVDYESERLKRICPEKFGKLTGDDAIDSKAISNLQDKLKAEVADPNNPRYKEARLIAGINQGRWYFPYILNPALYSGINMMFQTTMNVSFDDRDSFIPDFSSLGDPPPLWASEDLPEHPWQSENTPASPWMSKESTQQAFQTKSPFEMAMEHKGSDEEDAD